MSIESRTSEITVRLSHQYDQKYMDTYMDCQLLLLPINFHSLVAVNMQLEPRN